MNILQRKMFSNGDVAIQMPQEVIDLASELNVDITGKSAEEVERALEAAILQPKLIGKGGLSFFDYTDPLDYGLAALGLTGLGTGAATVAKSAKMAKKIKNLTDALNRVKKVLSPLKGKKPGVNVPGKVGFQPRNPLNPLSYNYKLPQSSFYGGLALGGIKSQQSPDIAPSLPTDIASMLEDLKNDDIERETSVESETKNNIPSDPKKLEKERIEKIKNYISKYQTEADILKAKQDEKTRISNRNKQNIFMEEIALSLAANRGDIGAGGAEGAATAAKRISEEEREDSKDRAKLMADSLKDSDLSPTEKQKIAETYSESITHLDNMGFIMGELDTLDRAIDSGQSTGFKGIFGRVTDKIQGFVGFGDEEINDATKAKQILEFIRSQLIRELLNESGRTISNLDRQLINQITGDIEDLGSGRGAIKEAVRRVRDRIRTAVAKSQNNISFIDLEYGQAMPNLQIYRRGFGQYSGTPNAPEDDVEVTKEDTID